MMFGRIADSERRIRELERRVGTLDYEFTALKKEVHGRAENVGGRLNHIEDKITSVGKSLNQVREAVGIERPGYLTLNWMNTHEEPTSFNLTEKIDAILQHLGLTERVKLENKLVPAPKSKKSKEAR